MNKNANSEGPDGELLNAELRRKIEERAYQIWLESGGRHGEHEQHWLQAERELMGTARPAPEQRSGGRGVKKTGEPRQA